MYCDMHILLLYRFAYVLGLFIWVLDTMGYIEYILCYILYVMYAMHIIYFVVYCIDLILVVMRIVPGNSGVKKTTSTRIGNGFCIVIIS